jgi:hypothetical protein
MATAKQRKRQTGSAKEVRLIVSDEKKPAVKVREGMRLEVVSVKLLDPTLKKSKATAARLCGGTTTCLALIDLDNFS